MDFLIKYETAKPHADGMASKQKIVEPITVPGPISFLVNKTLIADTNISGPDIPNGIRIELVISVDNFNAGVFN